MTFLPGLFIIFGVGFLVFGGLVVEDHYVSASFLGGAAAVFTAAVVITVSNVYDMLLKNNVELCRMQAAFNNVLMTLKAIQTALEQHNFIMMSRTPGTVRGPHSIRHGHRIPRPAPVPVEKSPET